jgi:hypothetical protein
MNRTDVYHSPEAIKLSNPKDIASGIRTMERFNQEDTNEVIDTQLKDLVEKEDNN